eukprot:gene16316-18619_t
MSGHFNVGYGISLAGLRNFVERCGGEVVLRGLSTRDVTPDFIKPRCLRGDVSYCAGLLETSDSHFVGRANAFVSHVWDYEFLHVIASLESHFGVDNRNIFIWFDVFACLQLRRDEPKVYIEFQVLSPVFRNAIGDINRTVLIVKPWASPKVISSMWCLWEIFSTFSANGTLEIAMDDDEKLLFESMICERHEEYYQLIGSIDISRAGARYVDDHAAITQAVLATPGGYLKVNQGILECIRTFIRQYLERRITEQRTLSGDVSPEVIRLLIGLCNYHMMARGVGSTRTARTLIDECVESGRLLSGQNPGYYTLYLTALHKSALVDMNEETPSALVSAHRKLNLVYEQRLIDLGEVHRDTIDARKCLAMLMGSDPQLIPQAIQVLEACVINLIALHRVAANLDILRVQDTIAVLLMKCARMCPDEHPDGRALLLDAQARFVYIIAQFQLLFPIQLHPDTCSSQFSYSGCLNALGEFSAAIDLLRPVVAEMSVHHGMVSSEYLNPMNSLACALINRGTREDLIEAGEIIERGLPMCNILLPAHSKLTKAFKDNQEEMQRQLVRF